MKALIKTYLLFAACIFMAASASAQQTAKQAKQAAQQAAVKGKIDAQAYTFMATYALPQRGGQRYLTSTYDLRVTKDSVIAFLPYFGRLYMSAPITPEENGVMFTSTKFTYKTEPKKKGGYTITIIPDGVKYVSKLVLDVFNDGGGSLMVTSNYRDPITFTGNLKQ